MVRERPAQVWPSCDKMSAISYPGNPGNQCQRSVAECVWMCFLRNDLTRLPRLAPDSQCSPGWLQTLTALMPLLRLSVDTVDVCYHVWLWDSDSPPPPQSLNPLNLWPLEYAHISL